MRPIPKTAEGVPIAPPSSITPDLSMKVDQPIIWQERKYELITPLFGGGVEPSHADPVTVIRGTAIRGHLRFWWRATRGGRSNGNLREMKKKEEELWGAASTPGDPKPSKVQIAITDITNGSQMKPFERGRADAGWQELAYAAFPLQEKGQPVLNDVGFTLSMSFPEKEKEEVEAALWAWETFGGIGARTRRGFGALKSGTLPGKPNKLKTRLLADAEKYVSRGNWPEAVPHLTSNLSFVIVTKKENKNRVAFASAFEAWEHLISELKGFRQSRSGRFGRSKWPEPEQIRRITGQRGHPEDSTLLGVEKFPRAVFGLPIIFHFKGGNEEKPYSSSLDPIDSTLKGGPYSDGTRTKYGERLASPLILRPLLCGNNQAVGLALLLEAPRVPPEGFRLTGDGFDEPVRCQLTKAEASKIEPLRKAANNLGHEDDELDVLQSFMDTLREKEEN